MYFLIIAIGNVSTPKYFFRQIDVRNLQGLPYVVNTLEPICDPEQLAELYLIYAFAELFELYKILLVSKTP